MTTLQEHLAWLQKHCSFVSIGWTKDGGYAASARTSDGELHEVSGIAELEECSRELCEDVCTHLGESCV